MLTVTIGDWRRANPSHKQIELDLPQPGH